MKGKLYTEFSPKPEPHYIYVIELDEPIPAAGDAYWADEEQTLKECGYLDIQDFCDDLHAIVETGIWPS